MYIFMLYVFYVPLTGQVTQKWMIMFKVPCKGLEKLGLNLFPLGIKHWTAACQSSLLTILPWLFPFDLHSCFL